ncbi:MAG TPA: hypothetical protein VMV33_17450 [Rhodocyclaceae bacterium]|nr:hypothetical protein [Rhodocyclaceae bacterium]
MAIRASKAIAAGASNVDADAEAQCLIEVMRFDSDMGRLRQAKGTMLKRFESMGVNIKGVQLAARLSKVDDAQSQYRANTQTLLRLKILSVDDTGQGSFIKGLEVVKAASPKLEDDVSRARAHSDGYNSGRGGALVSSCKFNAGSAEFVAWRDGWEDGHKDRLARNPDAEKVVVASGRKRGRPAGSTNKPKSDEGKPEAAKPAGRSGVKAAESVPGVATDAVGEPVGSA